MSEPPAADYAPPTPQTLDWVVRQVGRGTRVVAGVRLRGGITAAMDRITVESHGRHDDVVLRRWPESDEAAAFVRREAEALRAVRGISVPVPELLAADEDGTSSGVRCTLTTALEGQPDLVPWDMRSWLDQLAGAQAAIHRAPGPVGARWHGYVDEGDRSLEWLTDRGLREAAQEAAQQAAEQAAAGEPTEEDVFVHGDYQHFNVLRTGGSLTGVVDWPNAAMGSRGSDVGHCRLNLAVLFGPDVAVEYLTTYERAAGLTVDRRADLRSLLCWTPAWQHFIPQQVAGRAPLDVTGMPERVALTVRRAVDGIG